MKKARVTLRSVNFPKIAPYSVMVLQSFQKEGYKIILKDVRYKDRNKIINYFKQHHIDIEFASARDPEIEINDYYAFVNGTYIKYCNVNNVWSKIDQFCIENKIYERDPKKDFSPTYDKDSNFLVIDSNLPSQEVDSNPVSINWAHRKVSKIVNRNPSIKSVDVVDSVTFQVVEHFNKETGYFEQVEDNQFFNSSKSDSE